MKSNVSNHNLYFKIYSGTKIYRTDNVHIFYLQLFTIKNVFPPRYYLIKKLTYRYVLYRYCSVWYTVN
jgi:hypothetical protein